MRQIAALPYRIEPDGVPSVLLITSRETKRWVIPKGNPERGIDPHQQAEAEAFEEAGISGIMSPAAIGSFSYDKRRADGTIREAKVDVYLLAVTALVEDFPERDERDRRWFPVEAAVEAVDEPELKTLIRSLGSSSVKPHGKKANLLARLQTLVRG